MNSFPPTVIAPGTGCVVSSLFCVECGYWRRYYAHTLYMLTGLVRMASGKQQSPEIVQVSSIQCTFN